MHGFEKSYFPQAVYESFGVLVVFACYDAGHADVARLLDNLAHAQRRVEVGIRYWASAAVGPRFADGYHLFEVVDYTVLKGDHHGYGLHHRAGLEAYHGVVESFDVAVSAFRPLKVGDGLDVAGLHVHEHGASPVGRTGVEHAVELVFHYVLQLYVNSCAHVVAGNRLNVGPVYDVLCQRNFFRQTGHSVKQRVEGFFQSVDAVDFATLSRLAHTAYRAARHGSVGIRTAHHRFHGHARLVGVADIEERKAFEPLQVEKADARYQRPCARTLLARQCYRLAKPFAPFLAGADGECRGHRVGQGVDILQIRVLLEIVAAEVDAHGVVSQVSGENLPLVGEYVAAFGHYGVDLLQLPACLLVPLRCVDYRGGEKLVAYRCRKQ